MIKTEKKSHKNLKEIMFNLLGSYFDYRQIKNFLKVFMFVKQRVIENNFLFWYNYKLTNSNELHHNKIRLPVKTINIVSFFSTEFYYFSKCFYHLYY